MNTGRYGGLSSLVVLHFAKRKRNSHLNFKSLGIDMSRILSQNIMLICELPKNYSFSTLKMCKFIDG